MGTGDMGVSGYPDGVVSVVGQVNSQDGSLGCTCTCTRTLPTFFVPHRRGRGPFLC